MSLTTYRIIRYTMVFLFLWFGYQQIANPEMWTTYLPEWTGYFPMPSNMIVQLNGFFEIIFALLLLAGIFTRVAAGLLGLHLLGIAFTVGGAIGVRDFALAMTSIALAFSKPDEWTVDVKYLRKKVN